MRVSFVSHSADLAGAEQSLLSLVRTARARGHDVRVWLPGPGPLADRLVEDGLAPGLLRHGRNRWWMSRRGAGLVGVVRLLQIARDRAQFVRHLREDRPDVLVLNSAVAPAALMAASSLGVPAVTVVRESLRTNPTLRSLLPKAAIIALIARWSTEVVSISSYVARQVGRASTVINPPVRLPPAPAPARVDGGRLRLLMLGTIGGDKNQEEAVDAVSLALAGGADVRLDIYGGGPTRSVARLRARIARSGLGGSVTVHPPSRDVASLLADADAALVLSRNEAFGRVTVEALQAGVPVIGYARGGTAEILRGGGGVLVDATADAVAEAICRFGADRDLLRACRDEARDAGERWRAKRPDEELVQLLERIGAERGALAGARRVLARERGALAGERP
ncbi:glycosyltransferase [Georgenia sp. SYP-B2076]|uniref:glycosyltransferase n=1 Tax=Georgenia sp. SYP-B2076 TaxID=2495881 RepID=UPI000F8CA9D7|nr:glycosyltransferase [Georgenia sp. SYP-B2076]